MRLNKDMKAEIIDNMLAKAFGDAMQQANEALEAAMEALYVECMGGPSVLADILEAEAEIKKKLDSPLLKAFARGGSVFSLVSSYNFNIGGENHRSEYFDVSKIGHYRFDVAADNKLGQVVQNLAWKKADLKEKMAAFEAEATAIVNSCTTVNKLLTVWPEAQEFVPQNVVGKQIRDLAPVVDKLNDVLSHKEP